MKRLNILILSAAAAACLASAPGCGEKETARGTPPPPLILLFSIDTLRADHLGCYGYRRPTTPFIDGFAEDGIVFLNAITQGAVTAPGHMSIFTSLMPVVHRVNNPHPFNESIVALADHIPTWPQLLQSRGWTAYGLHGGGPVSAQFGFDRGFEVYRDDFFFAFETDYYRPEREIDTIREIVRDGAREGKPLFLFLHHYLCHDPYIKSPPELNHRFLPEPVAGLATGRADLRRGEDGRIDEQSFWDEVDLDNPEHLDHVVSLYDGSILYSDYIFGLILEVLREEGVYDRSLVILTSDHGEEFNEHGGYRHWKLFRENLHVPLIVKFPGGDFAGRIISPSVRTVDIFPSVFEYLGLPLPPHIQGVSFLPLLTGEGDYAPEITSQALDIHSPEDLQPRESVRIEEDGFVYSNQLSAGLWEDSLTKGTPEWLFEIAADPDEQNNLIETRPEVAERMRIRAAEILRENQALRDELKIAPGESGQPGEELRRQLKSLGYIQ